MENTDMFKALMALLFFITPSLSYAEKPALDTHKKVKSNIAINDSTDKTITPLEWFGYLIYAGSWWYIIIGNKNLEHNSYIHSRIEKTPVPYFKRPYVMKICSWSGVVIGSLILFASEMREYLKR